ncbi:MAG: hypothetical protein ACRYG8_22820, partial [Janthinobacterium lividum]
MRTTKAGLIAAVCALALSGAASAADTTYPVQSLNSATVGPQGSGQPLLLAKQGSFFSGGKLIVGSNGDTYHG